MKKEIIDETELVNIWKEELITLKRLDYNSSMLELVSFAFTKYIMKKWYNISSIYINIEYDEILNHYINKYLINK